VAVAIDPTKGADDIVSPGHVFPLVAREGGVLVRAGHTEASVDIARMAGLLAASVICEVMNDDGTMARLPDLIAFAQHHNLKIGTIADLIAYRRDNDHLVERVGERAMPSRYGDGFRILVYRSTLDGDEFVAVVRGAVKSEGATLVRMHRIDYGGDLLGGGPRAGLVPRALEEIAAEPEGGVLVLLHDTHPNALARRFGFLARDGDHEPEARMLREYGIGAQILRDLGVRRMTLLSNAPQKIVGLEGYGLSVEGWRPFKNYARD
jgi:3,4-dihydroxy 2-butanone 4-phosphate synthase/GTP cyclohydrolase II